jgi:hypothetical protein
MTNKKDTTKNEVMSEFLEDRIIIDSKDIWTAFPINEHLYLHYYKDGEPKGFMISFNQIIDLLNEKVKKT